MSGSKTGQKDWRASAVRWAIGLAAALAWAAWLSSPSWAKPLVGAGDRLPAITVAAPASPAHAAYLGVKPGAKELKLASIGRGWLLIEIFSMYCSICQGEAERVNQLYNLIAKSPLKDRLALIGIGAGNSDFEVKVFRDKYRIAFPLFSDGGFEAHQALGRPRTPYFLLVDLGAAPPRVVWAHLGPIGKPEDFLRRLLAETAGR